MCILRSTLCYHDTEPHTWTESQSWGWAKNVNFTERGQNNKKKLFFFKLVWPSVWKRKTGAHISQLLTLFQALSYAFLCRWANLIMMINLGDTTTQLLSLFYQWWNQGLEKINDLARLTIHYIKISREYKQNLRETSKSTYEIETDS